MLNSNTWNHQLQNVHSATFLRGGIPTCYGKVKCPEERHGITWNKYIEWKYQYSIGKKVLNVSLTAKVLGLS